MSDPLLQYGALGVMVIGLAWFARWAIQRITDLTDKLIAKSQADADREVKTQVLLAQLVEFMKALQGRGSA